jgi:excisionase family DNA binding protein
MPTLAHMEPVLPSEQEAAKARVCSRILAQHALDADLRFHLDDGTEVVLPPSALRLMLDMLTHLADGNAVTLIPVHAEMTTQQAADFLNVSRPFLVDEILEKGKVPFRKLGTHRRVLFQDLLDYKRRVDAESRKAFRELTEQAQELDMGY